jgi:MATE family multidrug resistance protein
VEFKPMLALALPVVLAELAWITMGIVDTLMVGPLGAEAIGAVGIGSSVFMGVCVFAMGLLLGLDTLVAQSYGANRLDDCHRWLVHGVVLGLGLTIPVTAILLTLVATLPFWGLDPSVLHLSRDYLQIVSWSLLPLLLYASFRRYLQATGSVRPIMVALVLANVVNAVFNWFLIFGKAGLPALGVGGSAWATVLSRVFMAAWLLLAIVYREWDRNPGLFHTSLRIEPERLRRLYALGLPAAIQITLEVGVFATATALAGRLAPSALAAHQIALNMAAFTFMVPFGISSAGAVRVGQAVGRGDTVGVARSGWTALFLGAAFMAAAAIVFLTCGRLLIGAFTPDPGVIRAGVSLLAIAAVFQLCDGLQGVATGILRGLGDTRTAMIWNFAGHWLIGLPLGYILCFVVGLGVRGLWWGLSLGLIICGTALLLTWHRRVELLTPKP